MKSKLLFIILTLAFSRCSASQSVEGLQEDSIKQAINNRFIEAAKQGATTLMLDLLRNGTTITLSDGTIVNAKPDVNARNKESNTALHCAAMNGHLDCLKALIQAQAALNAQNKTGYTALQWAAYKGHFDCLKVLLEAQADVHASNTDGQTALHLAAMSGRINCVETLIGAQANVNARTVNGATALHHAASSSHTDCVKALLEAKADVYAHDDNGNTALFVAAKHAQFAKSDPIDCIKLLVKHSYELVPSIETITGSRQRILKVLGAFVGLRNQHTELDNLKDATLVYEMLSWDKVLQGDLVSIFLDELKKGREIKSTALIRSKEAVILYLLRKVEEIISSISLNTLQPAVATFFDPENLKETLKNLIKEGLDERIEQLKAKKTL